MKIREAQDSDIEEMQRVRASVKENTLADYSIMTREMYEDHLSRVGRGWVCERGERVVGIAIANREEGSIWALFVEPEFEGQGIGRALHDTMLAWLRSEGVRRVSLDTATGTRAASFYEAAGWLLQRVDARGETYYEKDLDAPQD